MKKVKIGPHILVRGDCLKVMPKFPEKKVDLILCDLPYGTTDAKWDVLLPMDLLWTEYWRLTSTVILTASQPFTSRLVSHMEKYFKTEWIWQKNAGSNFGSVKYVPMKEHESILVFGKGRILYNPIMQERAESGKSRVKTAVRYNTKGKPEVYRNGGLNGMTSTRPELRYPSSIQKFNRERGFHPTQKPVPLVEYFLRTYTNEGARVLDNCMGSGTTGVACVRTGRRFVGIEKDRGIFETACDRINDAYKESRRSLFKE